MFLLTLGYFAYWIWIALYIKTYYLYNTNELNFTRYIYTSGEISNSQNGLPFAEINLTSNAQYFLYFHIASLIWHTLIFLALPQFIIASSVCIWYFSNNSKTKGTVG